MKKLNPELSSRLATLKNRYLAEGFVILGVVGSVARGKKTPSSKNPISEAIRRILSLELARQDLIADTGRQVVLAPMNSSNKVLKEKIERDLV